MPEWLTVSFQVLTSFIIAFAAIKVLNPVAQDIGLVDRPSARKLHQGNIPLIGGLSVFTAVLFAAVIWLPNTQELRLYLIASAMTVFIGVLDDKYDLSVRIRLVGQVIIASLMIYGVGAYISNLGDLFYLGDIDIGWLGIPFTYFVIIVAINAFNMIDGIDGLIGALSINTFTAIAILFLLSDQSNYLSVALIMATALLPFLLFNLKLGRHMQSKIFMGDSGSMFIGLSVVWLLACGTQGDDKAFSPATALWLTALPLMDMLSIVIRRLRQGLSPLKPDRDHIHHILMRLGNSPRKTLAIITAAAVFMSMIGIAGEFLQIPQSIMFALFIAIFAAYHWALTDTLVLKQFLRDPQQDKPQYHEEI
ncbi:UDP-N-acetylglucosamine--undecaprenyl-phosphate N-acetylglucosaminephosphotransferase [Thalassotalea sp. PS06]|uniref:UDP-N-acetylglucosamine--undecaprenyl-phosphate N-acetylglucosaminephosphotransferase n=1 Tax=Thalassotalea sp. PS06 TaxID=2594005 RepID=UPI0011643225|nr:UDP-N-acetylglucosamine--undecaprenyl-phosphate N-acetylglucosaminephosphotransferase [Thalassotalea sp. PS06]QDP01799.1 UDP-N-acetylglucosamine--undecaprenyl-phosphate N-acetylglucosaminephosphotransferase [Thalassotalea sp. PS06]